METRTYEIVPIGKIVADEDQPRKNFDASDMARLIASIKEHGIRNPLIVEKFPNGTYLLEDGERRYRAAKELGLKEVPVVTGEPKDAVTRLITQFHIQEQHQGWTVTEKAMAVIKLSEAMHMTAAQMGVLLSINNRSISQYMAFAQLMERTLFEKEELPLQLAERITRTKSLIRSAYARNDEKFTKDDEKKFEKAIIYRVKNGTINMKGDVTKFGDIARTNLDEFKKILKDDKVDLEETFSNSDAKAFRMHKWATYTLGHFKSSLTKGLALKYERYFTQGDKKELKELIEELDHLYKLI